MVGIPNIEELGERGTVSPAEHSDNVRAGLNVEAVGKRGTVSPAEHSDD